MTSLSTRDQLSMVEARLFASTNAEVIAAIDASANPAEAAVQLQALGMTASQATTVLDMPLRVRTQSERAAMLAEADRLRALLS